MEKIDEIKQQAAAVKNATQVGENTAERVGGALAGLADIAKEQEDNIRKKADKAAVDAEMATKANTADVDTKFTEEKNRVDVELNKKFEKANIAQELGNAEDKVMSQKAFSLYTKPLSVYRGKYLNYNRSNLINYDKIYMSELLLILNKDVKIKGNNIDKNLYGISFFDKDFNVITLSSLPDEVTNSFTFSPKASYVPENARYFCVYVNTRGIDPITKKIIVSAEESIFTGILYPEIVDSRDRIKAATEAAIKAATENVLYKDVLYGKKWAPCGDSFTAGDFTGLTENILIESGKYKGKKKAYPYIIGSRLNMDIVDSSISGSIMALDKSYVDGTTTDINLRHPFSHTRYKNIPKDVDYITIMFGLNDMSHSNLGSIDDIDNNSFYGAFNVVLEYFITNMPHAKIGIIISCGWINETYRKAMLEISEKWGIPILDMKGDINVPMMNGGRIGLNVSNKAVELRNKNFCVSSSNPHPNPVAYEYMSTFVENFLRSL